MEQNNSKTAHIHRVLDRAPVSRSGLQEPGFVIATTDDASQPAAGRGRSFHHIKNFAGDAAWELLGVGGLRCVCVG
jgi:hypothetical protein